MHRLFSLIPAIWPFRNPGTPAGMRETSVSTIHVPEDTGRAADCCEQQSVRPVGTSAISPAWRRFSRSVSVLCTTLLILMLPYAALAATPVGTLIDNIATATFNSTDTATSNLVRVTTVMQRTPSTITFLQYAPTMPPGTRMLTVPATAYSTTGVLASPTPYQPVGPTGLPDPLPLIEALAYHGGQPFYLSLEDQDQNLDPNTPETVLVRVTCAKTGDYELLLLTEDGNDSGIFLGYVLSETSNLNQRNGILAVATNSTLVAYYVDTEDGQDESLDSILVDPYGFVFDSVTGAPIDGALVTLYDVTANAPATVFYDDGSPGYPATVITGDVSLGQPAGGYRFPLILPNRDYRLDVVVPPGYGVPSQISGIVLRSQFGNQYAIDDQASFGLTFPVNPGPIIRIDIPADPAPSGLWLTKEAKESIVAIGDFLQYTLILENLSSSGTAAAVTIEDQLPVGFRYQKGSLKLNGGKLSNPEISSDGRSLTLTVGDLSANQSITINYVVEVAVGAKLGAAVNRATARDIIGTLSNLATATVTVRDDFFSNQTFLMGRVLIGSCETPETSKAGLSGARIYLEDGTYVITDSEGKYHYEGLEPGVHVVQLDLDTLPPTYEALPCVENSQFAGRSFSQFVDLKGGSLWRADFHVDLKPKAQGQATIELYGAIADNQASFRIPLNVGGVALDDLRLSVILPEGVAYLPGSSTLDGAEIADPDASGPVHTYRLGSRAEGWNGELALRTRVTTTSHGELPTKAVLTFNSPDKKNQRTPMAETLLLVEAAEKRTPLTKFEVRPNLPTLVATLSDADKIFFNQLAEELRGHEIKRLYAIGHTDKLPIAPRNHHIFADNQALSLARAGAVARYLGSALNLAPAQIVIIGKADTEPFTDNLTEQSRSLNRRVEVRIEGEQIARTQVLDMVRAHSGPQTVETIGERPGEDLIREPLVHEEDVITKMPTYDEQWLAQAEPGLEWLWPLEDQSPDIPSIKVAIKHQTSRKLTLLLNGKPVSPLAFEGTKKDATGKIAISIWNGIGIARGSNRFDLIVSDASGQELERISKDIHYAHIPVHAEMMIEESTLIADGRTSPVIAIRLTDKDGYPISKGMVGDFFVAPPYSALFEDEKLAETATLKKPRYQVGNNGIARIRLEPTPQAGDVMITIPVENNREELHTWLKPAPRDWILVGFAEGTVGYNKLSGNQVSLDEAGIDDHFYEDDRVKFFAKGAIKGEWLLTMAYDSKKPNSDGDSLHQIIDPDTYYPLYGDGTQQGYEASSARKLYVKIERDQFYALFGDMQTGLNQTELSQYNRSMNGIKSELQGETFSYTLFVADTKQAFAKDELRGDGTSGRYYLSQKGLVTNSETVTIETRDRFHSEQILDVQTLSRHTDYDIDYDTGSLFFKRPIASKDENFDPIYIVVNYETLDSAEANLNYGGRVAAKFIDQKVEVGASYVHEENGVGEGDLYGTDVTLKLTPQTTLHAEAARTETSHYDAKESGNAYLAEVSHEAEKITGNAYYREQQAGFGLGQQNGSEIGTRKYGAISSYKLTPQVEVAGEAYHQDNLTTDAKRDVAELQGRYTSDRYGLHTGLREARESFKDGASQESTQWLLGGNWVTPDRKLNLRGDYEQSLAGSNESSDFPTLLRLGADYKLTEKVGVFVEQEFSWGADSETEGTRAGFSATPWQGADFRTSVEQQTSENGQRVFALFGLGQSWQLNETWSFDASIDRSQTIKEPSNEQLNANVPAAHGANDDFTALSVGATYRKEKWTWWNRLETRQSDNEDKYGVSTSVVGEPKDGIAVSAKALAFISEVTDGATRTDGNIRLGVAYRPTTSRWIILNRLDFYFDKEENSAENYDNWRIVNHLHANFRLSRKTQMSFYYGLKYARDSFNGTSYSGFTDVLTFETRYNINKRWDFGLHGSILHSWNSGTFEYSAGGDIGYSPMTNTWVSLGYNLVGFEDEDFSDANYTAEGAYLRFRAKFDQQSVREAADWINR